LLRNQSAPLSVSIGAVHLLTHLHGRLEVLIKDDGEDCLDCEDYDIDDHHNEGDTPILWEVRMRASLQTSSFQCTYFLFVLFFTIYRAAGRPFCVPSEKASWTRVLQ